MIEMILLHILQGKCMDINAMLLQQYNIRSQCGSKQFCTVYTLYQFVQNQSLVLSEIAPISWLTLTIFSYFMQAVALIPYNPSFYSNSIRLDTGLYFYSISRNINVISSYIRLHSVLNTGLLFLTKYTF